MWHHVNTLVYSFTPEIGTTSLQGTKLFAPKCPLFRSSTVYLAINRIVLCSSRGGPNACSLLADSYQSYDQSQSFQASISKSNMSSFSVYEDTAAEQSSFVPFHDSWANASKDRGGGGEIGTHVAIEHKEGGVVYHVALGVPLEGGAKTGGSGDEVHRIVDQSFTQVGIPHPRIAPSISTPVGKNIG